MSRTGPPFTEHYYKRMENSPEDIEHRCIVCLEDTEETMEKLILYSVISQTRTCNCKYYIHRRCYESWRNTHDVCVVCRTPNQTYRPGSNSLSYSDDSSIYERTEEERQRRISACQTSVVIVRICFLFLLITVFILSTLMHWF